MMSFRVLIPTFTLVCTFMLFACGESKNSGSGDLAGREGARVRAQLVLDFRECLESSPEFHLLALDPMPEDAGEFHGFNVLGRTKIRDASERRALIEAFYKGVNANDGKIAACFSPRHGISLTGQDRIDFVICFECLVVHIHHGSPDSPILASALIDPVAEPVFDAAFKKHGLKKAGK